MIIWRHHRDLHSSFAGLPTGLACSGRIVIDSLVVKTKDVSGKGMTAELKKETTKIPQRPCKHSSSQPPQPNL